MRILSVIAAGAASAGAIFMAVRNNTEPKHLGVRDGRLAELPSSPNSVSSQTSIDEKRVDPLPFKEDLETTRSLVKRILEKRNQCEIVTESNYYIHAVFKSEPLRFKDDVEFYFDEANQRVDFRSSARTGFYDMGVNEKRYEEIWKEYMGN
ncbi:DUF1499 domain-containing protein [Salipaludibacillus sp. CUR1]|uniref:DUF1499 domain-containing protein n=1 Tax=Salipaludibacillus sp. CUR1 TaxID=2820003 RepID=UPI001E2F5BFB|nr:DUF1499 domain-containing protein [Salipaludibacillus sp. CUR1]MCE7792771.1 DUF1499 domain-containing protein [Salipaludibacillus sp. CUR1]